MAWRITEVDNGQWKYKLVNDAGESIEIETPPTHRTKALAKVHVKATCDSHDAASKSPTKKAARKLKPFIKEAATAIMASSGIAMPKFAAPCHYGILILEVIALALLVKLRK